MDARLNYLVVLLRKAAGGQRVAAEELEKAFDEFCAEISQVGCTPSGVRSLNAATSAITTIIEETHENLPFTCKYYAVQARAAAECELKIIHMQLAYPAFTEENKVPIPLSPLHWADNLTDLVELISGIYSVASIHEDDDKPARLYVIIKVFEKALNVDLGNFIQLRNAALNRKINPLRYLDRLKEALIKIIDKL